jgi:A/G-specific adenine glycosylase
MPWRRTRTPYRVLVSEIMLQQTSVARVAMKYGDFLKAFPSFRALAAADTAHVIAAWKGLGYNRRALALRETARLVSSRSGGRLPRTVAELTALPGIGPATAGAVLAYCFNLPIPFIETNIRRVFIHHFFARRRKVPDARIMPLVEESLDKKNPREWYYALMDYGTMLGRGNVNANRQSTGYKRQSAFSGSMRQLRGRVLEAMLRLESAAPGQISRLLGEKDERLGEALRQLVAEGFLRRDRRRYYFR